METRKLGPAPTSASPAAGAREALRKGGWGALVVALVAICAYAAFRALERGGLSSSSRAGAAPGASAAPTYDPAPERALLLRLAAELRSRQGAAVGLASPDDQPLDPWSTARALRGLVLVAGDDTEALVRMARALPPFALRNPVDGSLLGYPHVVGADNVALIDATADIAIALAHGQGRLPGDLSPHLKELHHYLRQVQNPDGSWSLFPVTRPDGAMAASTAATLQAACLLAAVLGKERKVAADLALSASALARYYDRESACFVANPARAAGPVQRVPGLDERCVLALLEARVLANRASQALDPRVDEVICAYAEAFRPTDLGPADVAQALVADYDQRRLFDRHQKASRVNPKWAPYAWRLWLASRLAVEAEALVGPSRARWAGEAARLRAHLPRLLAGGVPLETWQLADILFAAAVVHQRPPGEGAPLLVELARSP